MKKLSYFRFLFPVLLLNIFTATAQHNIYIGAKAGISIPNLRAGSGNQNPLSNGYSSRLGSDFGIFATFGLNKWLSIQPEIMYSEQGGKHDGMQAISNPIGDIPPYLYADFNNTAHLNYLVIPVMARFDLMSEKKFNIYFNAGGFAGFLLSAKTVSEGNSNIYLDEAGEQPISPSKSFDTTVNIKSSVNSFNAGIIGEVGLSYKIGQGKIFIEAGGSYGFINIQKYEADGTNYAGAATVHLGYMHGLNCKK